MMYYRIITGTIFSIFLFCTSLFAFDTLYVTADLDTSKHLIKGMVNFRLPDDCCFSEIELQLFANSYSSDDTPLMQSYPNMASQLKKSQKWGRTNIDSVFFGNVDLSKNTAINFTCMVISNINTDTISDRTVHVYFTTVVPESGHSLSYYLQEYLLSGWFPIPALSKECQWYSPEYNNYTDLMGDFRIFDISLTIPNNFMAAPSASYIVDTASSTKTIRYIFGPAQEFAISLSAECQTDSVICDSTIIKYYYHNYEKSLIDRINPAVIQAFSHMNHYVGEYPYPNLDIIISPSPFMRNFEFPSLISMFSPKGGAISSRMYETMAIRAVVGQWFSEAVGTDRATTPWLNKSASGLFTKKIIESIWGMDTSIFTYAGLDLSYDDYIRASSRFSEGKGVINRRVELFYSEAEFSSIVNARGVLALETFENLLGDSLLSFFWKQYYDRFNFKHIKYDDFMELADEVGGKDVVDILEKMLNSDTEIDYSVESVTNRRIDSVLYEVSYTLERTGDLDWPINYNLILYNNDTINIEWKPEYHTANIIDTFSSPVQKVLLDPDCIMSIDIDLMNNSLLAETDSRPTLRVSSGVMFLIESLLSYLGGI